jgi:regulation of enolase protein 1 (concanavalin A-like superfamily)
MRSFLAVLLIATLLLVPSLSGAEPDNVAFEDRFDSMLAKEWTWLREDAKSWRITKEGLEIRALPGHGTERKNILLRPPRKAGEDLSVEVFLDNEPSVQFEHAGIQCYFNERNWVGLVKEKVGASEIVLTQVKDGKPKYATAKYEARTVLLRMQLKGNKAIALYRATDKDEWKKMGECDLPAEGEFRLGLAAGGGPKDVEHWARFRDFRVITQPK